MAKNGGGDGARSLGSGTLLRSSRGAGVGSGTSGISLGRYHLGGHFGLRRELDAKARLSSDNHPVSEIVIGRPMSWPCGRRSINASKSNVPTPRPSNECGTPVRPGKASNRGEERIKRGFVLLPPRVTRLGGLPDGACDRVPVVPGQAQADRDFGVQARRIGFPRVALPSNLGIMQAIRRRERGGHALRWPPIGRARSRSRSAAIACCSSGFATLNPCSGGE